jgi:DNA-binding beta-propeller fold protein YncE
VVFDADGRLLVADTDHSRIAVYRVEGVSGELVGELRGAIRRPEGVAVHPDGRVYATGAASGNVVIFDAAQVVAEAGGLAAPHDIVAGPDGTLWVADSNNDRLLQFSRELEVLAERGAQAYRFRGPRYLDFDTAGRLYVADKYSHQIKVLDTDGSLLLTLGDERAGLGADRFDRPEGVAIRGSDVWFSDTYNDRIVRYRIRE